jgi:5-methylcytosine-specific restriction endonuclease McrA
MARCLRSKRLRALLWSSTGGKCSLCGCDLIDLMDGDHIVPWSKRQRTNLFEMQPTCPECNKRKGNR